MKTYTAPACQVKTVSLAALYPIIEETLQNNDCFSLHVTGKSMAPFLVHMRDQAILAPLAGHAFRKGDILFYRRAGGQFVMHRVYAVEKDASLTLLGDAQWTTEPGIRPEQVLARVPKVIRKGKTINCERGFFRFLMTAWQLRIRFPRLGRLCLRALHSLMAIKKKCLHTKTQ